MDFKNPYPSYLYNIEARNINPFKVKISNNLLYDRIYVYKNTFFLRNPNLYKVFVPFKTILPGIMKLNHANN